MEFRIGPYAGGRPRDGWPSQKAVAMASGAGRLLDEAGHFDRVEDALVDAHFVLATTARPRGLTKPVLSPEEAMRQAAERIARGENVSIMFGPERSGLENEDIAQANAIVSVPVNPDFPSLNLAQCVLLLGYEWRRATENIQAETMEMAKTEWAETGEIEKLSEHFETTLDQAGFFSLRRKQRA